jgi:hypothetical protein
MVGLSEVCPQVTWNMSHVANESQVNQEERKETDWKKWALALLVLCAILLIATIVSLSFLIKALKQAGIGCRAQVETDEETKTAAASPPNATELAYQIPATYVPQDTPQEPRPHLDFCWMEVAPDQWIPGWCGEVADNNGITGEFKCDMLGCPGDEKCNAQPETVTWLCRRVQIG